MSDKLQRLERDAMPPLLAEIPDPPKQMILRGAMPPFSYRWLAVVGSRALTSYGKQACEYLISGLRGYPIVIVSGLAYGADACAHKAALEAGLPTIAVPGSGLDWSVMYPRAHVALAQEIIRAGGAHLSEYEPTQKAADYTFPRRNRIMAGMSHATLVIEAQEKSGSLITARLATDYNRELLVVPGSIFSAQSKGAHQFLKLGAIPVTEPSDILKALHIEERVETTAPHDLTREELRVFDLLREPASRDDIYDALGLPITESAALLMHMEIKGLIVEEFGMIRKR